MSQAQELQDARNRVQQFNAKAASCLNRGDLQNAIKLAGYGCMAASESLRPPDPVFLGVHFTLGKALSHAGRFDHAVDLLLKVLQELPPQDPLARRGGPSYADTLATLSMAYLRGGYFADAEDGLQQVLAFYRAASGEEHGLALALNNLSGLYLEQSQYPEAEPLLREALALPLIEETDAELHAQLKENLARSCAGQGRFQEAETLYLDAIEQARRHLPPDHPMIGQFLGNLGYSVYQATGAYQEALPVLQQAIKIDLATYGRDSLQTATAQANLALCYHETGNLSTAQGLFIEALDVCRRQLVPGHPKTLTLMLNLGLLQVDLSQFQDAEAIFQEALSLTTGNPADSFPSVDQIFNDLGLLYLKSRDYGRAAEYFTKALDLRVANGAPPFPQIAVSLNNLGLLKLDSGHPDEAVVLFRQSLQLREEAVGTENPHYEQCLFNLRIAMASLGRYEECLLMLKTAAETDDLLASRVSSATFSGHRFQFMRVLRQRSECFLTITSLLPSASPARVLDAFLLVLKRKSVASDALTVQRRAILGGRYEHLRPLLKELDAVTTELAEFTLSQPEGDRGRERVLQQRHEQLEADLARQIPDMRMDFAMTAEWFERLRIGLPAGSCVIELVACSEVKITPETPSAIHKAANY